MKEEEEEDTEEEYRDSACGIAWAGIHRTICLNYLACQCDVWNVGINILPTHTTLSPHTHRLAPLPSSFYLHVSPITSMGYHRR